MDHTLAERGVDLGVAAANQTTPSRLQRRMIHVGLLLIGAEHGQISDRHGLLIKPAIVVMPACRCTMEGRGLWG